MINSIIFKTNSNIIDVIQDPEIKLTDIQGISALANINTSSLSGYDGSTIISSQTPMRNITMILRFANVGDCEEAKHRVYSCFSVKSYGVLYIKTNTKDVKIQAMVEKCEIPPNSLPMVAQISLLCPNPYFTDLEPNSQTMAYIKPLFKFPHIFDGGFKFSERSASVIDNFINGSTADVYPIIKFTAINEVENPSIMNVMTYEKMKVNVKMSIGDILIINTGLGVKSVKLNDANYFNHIDSSFVFFKLYQGNNYLKYDADSNPMSLKTTVTWDNYYGGV